MIKKLLTITLIITALFLPIVFADSEVLNAREATIDLDIVARVEFVPLRSNAVVSDAQATLKWIPYEYQHQRIVRQELTPQGELTTVAIVSWTNPSLSEHLITHSSRISTNNRLIPIQEKIVFPIQELDSRLLAYTRPSRLIDENEDIVALASKLAGDSDDLYEVVFRLARWTTENIDYNLTTMTAEATHPSSWVLENRYGVCDELTNLFISLNRALGIPARFVSGLAYTDLEIFDDNWGAHGWAEVYFPGSGWVPYDVTYATYGYVTSGHIKLKDSVDSGESSVEFEASGREFRIASKPLEFVVEVINKDIRPYELLDVSLETFFSETGLGGYNALIVHVRNRQNTYVSSKIDFSRTQGITLAEERLPVMLKPFEEKTYHVLFIVSKDLDSRYEYTFPISARTTFAQEERTSFSASKEGSITDKEFFRHYLKDPTREQAPVRIRCDAPEFVKEEATINCFFEGDNQQALLGLACINEHCVSATTPKTVTHTISKDNPGLYTVPVRFSTNNLRTNYYETIQFVDETQLRIINLTSPQSVRYEDLIDVSFVLEQTSHSSPETTRITISGERFSQSWDEYTNAYTLTFPATKLRANKNTIEVLVEYTDLFGETKKIEEQAVIDLVELTVTQRVNLFLYSLQEKIALWLS